MSINRGFETNRYRAAKECPCGKSNKDGKFAPFKGETEYGKCHSCGETFFPPEESNAPVTNLKQKYIYPEILQKSQVSLGSDNFTKHLAEIIGDHEKAVDHLKKMNVGSDGDQTIFWMVDEYGRVCQPKRFQYDESGHKIGIVSEKTFNQKNGYYPCLFNASEISDDDRTVIIVESEKSAVIGSYFYPDYIWTAAGGATALSYDKAHQLRDRNVIILYDSDESGRKGSENALNNLGKAGAKSVDFDLFPERIDGYDIADFIFDRADDQSAMDIIIGQRIKKHSDSLKYGAVDELEAGIIDPDEDWMVNRYLNDLKDRGETSHFYELDEAFKWKRGLVYTYTGYPGSGKSEINLFLCMLKAVKDGWKYIMFVPESMSSNEEGMLTIEEVYDTLIHIYTGMPVDISDAMSVPENKYRDAIRFIKEHFTFIYPKKGLCTQEDIIEQAEYVLKTRGAHDGIVIDPFNNVRSSIQRNELIDEYLRRIIMEAKTFAVNNRLAWVYVTHPPKQTRLKDGTLPKLDMDSIRGGAAFSNGSDFVIVIDRPNYWDDTAEWKGKEIRGRNHPLVHFDTKKVKNQKLLGCRPNTIQIFFDRISNRYWNEYDISPFDEAYKNYDPSKFPESKEDDQIMIKFEDGDDGLPF